MASYEDQGSRYDPHGEPFENVGRRKPLSITVPSHKPVTKPLDTTAEDMFRRQNPGR